MYTNQSHTRPFPSLSAFVDRAYQISREGECRRRPHPVAAAADINFIIAFLQHTTSFFCFTFVSDVRDERGDNGCQECTQPVDAVLAEEWHRLRCFRQDDSDHRPRITHLRRRRRHVVVFEI